LYNIIKRFKNMFLDIDKKDKSSFAAIDDAGGYISYCELCFFAEEFYNVIGKRTLIFILSENSLGSLTGYVGSLSGRIVPLLLSCNTDRGMLANLISIYQPEYLWIPMRFSSEFNYKLVFNKFHYVLLKTGLQPYKLNEDLSLLLTTSGSTGSPKLVRHSYLNVEVNARNVAVSAGLEPEEKAVAILPMHFTMGLFVINSHLFAGARVLLTQQTLTDRSFWQFIKDQKATNISGVPYSFEVLHKLRFFNMDLPDLKLLIQGGGKLKNELFKEYAEFAQKTGKKFLAAYGQTEGSSRMAFLKPDLAIHKTGSIGKAIVTGHLSIIDENGAEIEEMETVGEMVYKGPNVTLGYAYNGPDLAKGDENGGVLRTGDIARRDADGYYYIVGRISRFLKLYGLRIGLDETEQMIRSAFGLDCLCTGNDEKMIIKITDNNMKEEIHKYVVEKTGLFHACVEVTVIEEIPRNEAGKKIY
jgi:acyl-coenzyme A synthetase/AMP-(fatty) acid ligase